MCSVDSKQFCFKQGLLVFTTIRCFLLPALKFRGHVPQSALVFITDNTQHLCTFLLFSCGYRTIAHSSDEICSHHPDHLRNPNNHNEGNMNNPIIIPCCLNNLGAVDGIFFLSFLRVTLLRPFPLIWAGVSCSFPCFGARLHGCHSVWGVLFVACYVRCAIGSIAASNIKNH